MKLFLLSYTGYFNSRPHKEVDRNALGHVEERRYFNSRPHKEVDIHPADPIILVNHISTHDLTRRSTAIFTQKVFLSKSLFVLIAYNTFILY